MQVCFENAHLGLQIGFLLVSTIFNVKLMLFMQSPLGYFYVQLKHTSFLSSGPLGQKTRAHLMGAVILLGGTLSAAQAQTPAPAQQLSQATSRTGVYLTNRDEVIARVQYPAILKETHKEGYVLVNIRISAQGKYLQHYVRQATHPLLAQAIAEPLMWVQFAPTDTGKPMQATWVTVPFRFKLD